MAAKGSSVPTSDVVDAMVQTSFVVTAALSVIAADHDVSLTQMRVMAILRDRRLRMGSLAAYLGLERSTMSGLVDRGVRRGLMQREAGSDDGRAIEVFLTASGLELADRVHDVVVATLGPLLDGLPAGDRGQLHHLLATFLAPTVPASE